MRWKHSCLVSLCLVVFLNIASFGASANDASKVFYSAPPVSLSPEDIPAEGIFTPAPTILEARRFIEEQIPICVEEIELRKLEILNVETSLANKNILPLTPPAIRTFSPLQQNRNSLADTGTNRIISTQDQSTQRSGPGRNPNEAPYFPAGGFFDGVITRQDDQHWFFTQAPRSGQMTIHLDIHDSTVDYDLYVFWFNPATGQLFNHRHSTRGPGQAEHISFNTTQNRFYFIMVHAFRGHSAVYTLHVDMAAQGAGLGAGEIDNFREMAHSLVPNRPVIERALETRTDEDWFRFTAQSKTVFDFRPATNGNLEAVADVFRGNTYIGTVVGFGRVGLNTVRGATYYIRVRHVNNRIFGQPTRYAIGVMTFGIGVVQDVLGIRHDNTEVAFVSQDDLWVNDIRVFRNIQNIRFDFMCNNHPRPEIRSTPVSPPLFARFVTYSSTRPNFGGTVTRGLAVRFANVHFQNWVDRFENGVITRRHQAGHTSSGENFVYFILDIGVPPVLDVPVRDLASRTGNGFYNFFFDQNSNRSFTITDR